MKVWTCNNFKGFYPVGSAAVVVAGTKKSARKLLKEALQEVLCDELRDDDFTVVELNISSVEFVFFAMEITEMRELEDAKLFCRDRHDSLECTACVYAHRIVSTTRSLIRANEVDEASRTWSHYMVLFEQKYGARGMHKLRDRLIKVMVEVFRDGLETNFFIEASRN